MRNSKSKIAERKDQSYSLIHGELAPQHIWLLNDGTVGIIDIEAVKYFDIEYDWVALGHMYKGVIPLPKNIDIPLLDFYKLCLKIGYVSIGVDYITNVDKNNTFFKEIRYHNLKELTELFMRTNI